MNEYEIIEFKNGNIELSVNVSPKEDTVWLTKEQIAILFCRDRSVISKHVNNILKEKELDDSTCAFFAHVQKEGNREVKRSVEYYNLDMIISIGYRVKSQNGIIFRKWANSILKDYLLKGYVINENRTLITNENYINLINKVDSIDSRLKYIESNEKYYNEKLIVDGELFDAIAYLEELVSKSKLFIINVRRIPHLL